MISQLSSKPIRNTTRAERQSWTKWFAVLVAGVVILAGIAFTAARLGVSLQTPTKPADADIQPQVFIVPQSELPAVTVPMPQKKVASQASNNITPASVAEQVQTVSMNNVTAQLRSVGIVGGVAEADVCLHLPSNADWLPEARMTVAGNAIEADSMQLLDAKNPATYESSNRCYRFGFPIQLGGESIAVNTPVQVTVTRLVKSLPEVSPEQAANAGAATTGEVVEGPWTFTTNFRTTGTQ
ncbi:MAG: hypothetical protein KatS3mg053_0503 [Candidatus Roseilinea sp.]|nr:MAG: hypothetical protein KatS3mg053_0503 [Candidatus Roseilinea sp.]